MAGSAPDTTECSFTYADITSPSQLQEVTFDADFNPPNSMGIRSPGGPMRGRSVKEFEEQLSSLKKENFNLKLRIYFLEERMGSNFNLDKENVVKKNVELMVEIESLKKELHEKHQLLCQAVKAIELEEEERKRIASEKDELLAVCQQDIENLKSQLTEFRHDPDILTPLSSQSGQPGELYPSPQPFSIQESAINVIKELQEKINVLEDELAQEKANNAAVQMVLDQKDSKVITVSKQLEELQADQQNREDAVRDLASRLDETKTKYLGLCKKLQEKSRLADELVSENSDMRKRHQMIMHDWEKEQKRYEKLKLASESKIEELQARLEMSLSELKKSQDLVVSKNPARRAGNTYSDSFSVPKPATPPGSPQKDPFLVPPTPSPIGSPVSSSSSSPFCGDTLDLKNVIEKMKIERDAQQQKIIRLKSDQMKACKIIRSMIDARNQINEEMVQLKEKNDKLANELKDVQSKLNSGVSPSAGSAVTTSNLPDKENSMMEQSEELIEHYKQLTDELEEKNRVLQTILLEKDNHYKKIQEQYEEILENLKLKENHIVDLEFELLSMNHERSVQCDEQAADSESNSLYIKKLQEKDSEIERLNRELMKRNFDLQTLVNNELWSKNREIERLQKKQETKLIEAKDKEIVALQNELIATEVQLKIIKEKISELGIEIDFQSGGISVENNMQIELEKSEKLRCETNQVCGVLSSRLEELAVFLDSLLKQKSILGFLGGKENKRWRQMISQSLDLSRSFNMSFSMNSEKSLLQLTNITSILNDTSVARHDPEEDAENSSLSIIPANISLTYQSHLYKKDSEDPSEIIETLRQQIVNLKYELQLRDVELNKVNGGAHYTEVSSEKDEVSAQPLNTTSTTLKYKSDNQSESEAWSEPDRSVSRARIGLVDENLTGKSNKKNLGQTSTDSTEDEAGARSSRTPSKKVLNDSRNTILELHRQMCELDQKLQEKELAYCETLKVNNSLKKDFENLETKLRESEDRKVQAENKLEELQQERDRLFETVTYKDKDLRDKISEIEAEKEEALIVAKAAEEAAKEAKDELKDAENKLRSVQTDVMNLEKSLRTEYEKQLLEKATLIQNETEQKVEEIQKQAEFEVQALEDTLEHLQTEYEENYVKKVVVEEAVLEIERLKSVIVESEDKIKELSCEEREARYALSDYKERVNALMADLNNATLQYSEAVLDKTKMANEKATLEQELDKALLKEVDQKKRMIELENEIGTLKQNHLKQVSSVQQQRSRLEVRISELESSNAELHNRLIKIQAGFGDHMLSTSLPTPSNNFVNEIVSFRRQHSDSSTYLSEEHFNGEDIRQARSFNCRLLLANQNVDVERHEANSSPDLGIESDQGRFSSLETHLNLSRPLLQTLELTESMSNLLDAENNQVQAVNNCSSDHCCSKSLQMANENSDLKRKLLRTRRALEETVTQLTLANQRKKQVEKNICNQIHKTSQVLRKAKANLDSGSETDLYKK